MTIPPLKHFGPLLVVWGAAMLMLVFIRDLGSSLMFFGAFLALLYVATDAPLLRRRRAGPVLRRRLGDGARRSRTSATASTSGSTRWHSKAVGAGQIQQSLFAQADGGLFGQGLGESLLKLPGPFAPHCAQPFPDCGSILPAPHTDEIYAVIVSELGLFGGAGLIADLRADRRARLQDRRDGAATASRSCSPPGLTAVFALQAFVIVGGVVQVDPADRRDPAVRQLRRQLGDREHDPARRCC